MCEPKKTDGVLELLVVGGAKLVWWLLQKLAQAVRGLFVALLALTVWASPRVHRLARRGYRAGRRWYALRPVLLDREPVAAVTATTTAPTLADLKLKQEANA